ncbi:MULTISPECIES: META domain-containing protein [Vibrio]|jgi:heat shock protein HslJ|uniref:Heat-shock protein HslJ n=1 Tax=Vibrio mediterranei TaxID=689 RepID=A0A241T9A8_9VIBR|nr:MULTISPECIES: META domain-containing protein [Vibrio]ASI90603.1 heat-shock protein HslJ [Vibrio mediterranei]ASI91523.1 heat-shock protein HslJ [Vibrio mediterranei]AYV22626.1 META domain-containing protein [Vibrio mediterranei]EDL53166.1 heat shock protein [Vibrio mediterranei AK1]KFA96948.1 heat shock protein HslJ [Vibrio sp. ER1A]
MKIFSKKLLAAVALPVLMTACAANDTKEEAMKAVTAQDLQHHNWNLVQIDGNAIQVDEQNQTPRLEIGEKMTANGNAGCNNFFGQGELKDGQFRIEKMGMTMKMCAGTAMDIEQTMSKTLSDWSDITVTKNGLELKGAEHTLTFELKDWMN